MFLAARQTYCKCGHSWGAAHMPDFDKRLKEDFGMKRTESEWITAWNLADDGPRN